jgi:hypothetical protein
MAEQITITTINGGTEPFSIYLCDENGNNCIYIDSIVSIQVPYNFLSPSTYENLPNKIIKVIDSVGCQINAIQ